jgi:hypothetical protein
VKTRPAILAALPAAALILAAPAGAATLTTDKPCYAERTQVTLTGTGYTPGSSVGVLRDNVFQGNLTSTPAGAIGGLLAAPTIAPARERTFNLTAVDGANQANQGSVTPLVTLLDVVVRPSGGHPARRRRITARGFPRGKNLWAHVVRKGRNRNVKIGRLKGACGKLKKRKRIFSRNAKAGTYKVQFDVKKRYRRSTKPRVSFRVSVFRTLRSTSAGAASGERWVRID